MAMIRMILRLDKAEDLVAKVDSIPSMVHLEEVMQAEESNSSTSSSRAKVDLVDPTTTSKASNSILDEHGWDWLELVCLSCYGRKYVAAVTDL